MHDLGLSQSVFWKLTPAQFRALMHRVELSHERSELQTGIIAATIANGNLSRASKRKKAFTPEDFMPSVRRKAKPKAQQPWEAMLAQVVTLNTMFGGVDKRELNGNQSRHSSS